MAFHCASKPGIRSGWIHKGIEENFPIILRRKPGVVLLHNGFSLFRSSSEKEIRKRPESSNFSDLLKVLLFLS
jgi:hypothetical protein